MPREILRPSRSLGSYPERSAEGFVGLDEFSHRTAVRLGHRIKTGRWYRRRFLARVNAAGEELRDLSGRELSQRANTLRQALTSRGLANELVISAFALIRELAGRTLKMRHYDSQVLGGWVILNGMLAEMETGEGKTLTATLPACTAAMAGIPVHVITVNDYLAQRDAELMAPLYKLLGLTVSAVTEENAEPEARRKAYRCNVTYCTDKQLAFDYLRDRVTMGNRRSELRRKMDELRTGGGESPLLLRGLCFAIVDEADSVLIDEARTPLILSRTVEGQFDEEVYPQALELAARLKPATDFSVNMDERSVDISEAGKSRLAELSEAMPQFWHRVRRREYLVTRALSALHLYLRDQHYLVRDNKVMIVDEHTGRLMPDRSWEMGMHQMVETKENCEVTPGREAMAKITYQRFFRRYLRFGAMSGTATEVAGELWSVYGLRVVKVPSHKPVQRRAEAGRIYLTAQDKWRAIVAKVKHLHRQQRPVLIGTRSVEASEQLSALLTVAGLTHRVLNARNDKEEAEIVACAGEAGRITVATNMAGRGTDISLGEGIREIGGLHVIATECNEARRVDRQLFGRCGRQGDPGSYEVLLSLEDEFVESHAPGVIKQLLRAMIHSDTRLAQLVGAGLIRIAQLNLERRHARIRRNLIKMDRRLGDVLAFTGPME